MALNHGFNNKKKTEELTDSYYLAKGYVKCVNHNKWHKLGCPNCQKKINTLIYTLEEQERRKSGHIPIQQTNGKAGGNGANLPGSQNKSGRNSQ